MSISSYFNRKPCDWDIVDFLNKCKQGSFEQKIDRYLKSLKNISDNEKDKRKEKAMALLNKYKRKLLADPALVPQGTGDLLGCLCSKLLADFGISGNIATINDKTGTINGGTFEREQSLPSIPKSRKRKIKDLPEIKNIKMRLLEHQPENKGEEEIEMLTQDEVDIRNRLLRISYCTGPPEKNLETYSGIYGIYQPIHGTRTNIPTIVRKSCVAGRFDSFYHEAHDIAQHILIHFSLRLEAPMRVEYKGLDLERTYAMDTIITF
ncbi:928_t:CDS:2 [Ambispora leptoticha]|uniref:928_t:CDS:1 n=1 Tax=Ambispora leptoticha TaxID=144679 RepID=A0A9N9BSP6_9GLOM|nr:928_t:CDS:2 [Ambispora leptoticha]